MDYQAVMLEFHKDYLNSFEFGDYFTCENLISKGSSGYLSELEFMGLFHHEGNSHQNGGDYVDCILSNEFEKNLNLEVTLTDTYKDFKCMRLSGNCSFLSLVEKDDMDNADLKLELDTVETQYQQCFQELARIKMEAIDACSKRWAAKKNLAAYCFASMQNVFDHSAALPDEQLTCGCSARVLDLSHGSIQHLPSINNNLSSL
ncbi:hypothetical protein CQW23_34031 [Capsicum baccatum]|uniref:Uncharacterized protein n=1 Tax=Capsicum baccatum TaxID=33114 RepID=A0A2G2V031_CAPBA|nr:hypothetical protein CQW23_34031 [Capsicum baccatum]